MKPKKTITSFLLLIIFLPLANFIYTDATSCSFSENNLGFKCSAPKESEQSPNIYDTFTDDQLDADAIRELKTHTIKLPDKGKSNGILFYNMCFGCLNLHGPGCAFSISSFKGKYAHKAPRLSCEHSEFQTDLGYMKGETLAWLFYYDRNSKFSFKDVDHNNDLDLVFTSPKDFKELVWFNYYSNAYTNAYWSVKPKVVRKEFFYIFLHSIPRLISMWIVFCIFALPVLYWRRFNVKARAVTMSLCPVPAIISYITCVDLFRHISLVLFSIIYLGAFLMLIVTDFKKWKSMKNTTDTINK